MADRAVALAVELGLDGSSVFFNRDWVPYDERLAWFAEADLGVSAHRDSFGRGSRSAPGCSTTSPADARS